MRLNKLLLRDFRNYKELVFQPSHKFNYLFGPNGSGKTNLLEAIYFLAHLRSFRRVPRSGLKAEGKDGMCLQGVFIQDNDALSVRLEAVVSKGERRYRLNGKEENNLIPYLSQVNVVVFFPDSLRMIKEGPTLRRSFVDRAIAAQNSQFLVDFREYNRLVSEKNQLLRRGTNSDIISIWEQRLIDSAAQIIARRCVYLNSLRDTLDSVRQRMEIPLSPGVYYRAGGVGKSGEDWTDLLKGVPGSLRENAASFLREGAKRVRDEEKRRGVSLWGPHLDDFEFCFGTRKVKTSASQGEQRLFAILLVIATAEEFRESQFEEPIILLDDLSSELDSEKTLSVLRYLGSMDTQVFITSTQKPSSPYHVESASFFQVRSGIVTAL